MIPKKKQENTSTRCGKTYLKKSCWAGVQTRIGGRRKGQKRCFGSGLTWSFTLWSLTHTKTRSRRRGYNRENARLVAGQFPVLEQNLPPKRKPWESGGYRMSMFAAAALAMAYLHLAGTLFCSTAERSSISEHPPASPNSLPRTRPQFSTTLNCVAGPGNVSGRRLYRGPSSAQSSAL